MNYGDRCTVSQSTYYKKGGGYQPYYHGAGKGCAGTNPKVTTVTKAILRGLQPHNCWVPDPIDIGSTEPIPPKKGAKAK